MKLEQIIEIANAEYPDDCVKRAFEGEEVGDGLATFIANELEGTFEGGASTASQLLAARSYIQSACRELENVLHGFKVAYEEATSGPRIERLHTIRCLMKANEEAGQYFFTRETMQFFKSRILDGIYKIPAENKILFVSSERMNDSTPREYRVRVFTSKTSKIESLGEETYSSARAAKKVAEECEKNNSTN